MSNVNIKRAIENIRSSTNVYTPLVEIIVNAIDAIEAKNNNDGKVEIHINRSSQSELDGSSSKISGFTVIDNGIGFTDKNREAFDTLYTANKIQKGGKGFGRFTCLKYYEDIKIKSTYKENGQYFERSFRMGKDTDIIIEEDIKPVDTTDTGTTIKLISIKQSFPDASISTISRTLVEKLLPFFVDDTRSCPRIVLFDNEKSESRILNDYIEKPSKFLIKEVKSASGEFILDSDNGNKKFLARVFKIYSPKVTRSKVNLVAHRRVVTSTSLHNYIPEFIEEFYDQLRTNGEKEARNFIIKVYVFGDYLDEHVSVERGGFEFKKEKDLFFGISQKEIESHASNFACDAVEDDVEQRRKKTEKRVSQYVREEAPWYTDTAKKIDYSELSYNPSYSEIENHLHKKNFQEEVKVKSEVQELLKSNEPNEIKSKTNSIVRRITDSSKNELTHYIALRKSVLDIFDKSLKLRDDGKYESEEVVHDIIFPTKEDNDSIPFEGHNLWIIDERLSFTNYLSSDLPLDGPKSDRPDILAFDNLIGFRGENEPSSPVTIFEFKRPQRDDFANPSSEDPIQQIIRYVRQIKEGKYQTPEGREIYVRDTTPFYGYVICDINKKVRDWLTYEKDFKVMPDNLGYFNWHDKLNLYLEVLSWDKILKDAEKRNAIFFHKLGIDKVNSLEMD